MTSPGFRVEAVEYARQRDDLLRVRETVFVREQHVPLEEERDALDPLCLHVLARDEAGRPIGTGRLTPERRIGRMAVLREWRSRGVGDALLAALLDLARRQHWPELSLNAQISAETFYARHGFVPYGPRFHEAGIEHQAMRRRLDGATAIEDQAGARAALMSLANGTRRRLDIYSRDLEPGLFDAPEVLEALRRLAIRPGAVEIRFLLQDAGAPQRRLAPLLPLAQRLPSTFRFREVHDPVDRNYPSAYAVNDADGYYFRTLGHRFEGEADPDAAGRARQLREEFAQVWERSRPCTEYRALGL